MRYPYAVFLLFTLSFGTPCVSIAQNDTLYFRHFSVDQGLTQRNVTSIIQDSLGFMYYGTHEGLNKFDGYKFFPLKHDPKNKNSLVSDDITCMTVEKSGIIWIGTRMKGLNRYDPYTGIFTLLVHDGNSATTITDDRITALYADSIHQCIWIGTENGLNSYDLSTKQIRRYNSSGNEHELSNAHVTCITKDRTSLIWIGTAGGGLNMLDPATSFFTVFRNTPTVPAGISSNLVRAVFADKQNCIWVATAAGLNCYDQLADSFQVFRHDDNNPFSVCSDDITSVYQDKYGKIWVGTSLDGLCVYYPSIGKFFLYSHEKDVPNSLSSNCINTISQGRSGMFWAATSDGGLNAFNPKTLKFHLFDPDSDENGNTVFNKALSMFFIDNNTLLIGTAGKGLFEYSNSTNTIVSFLHDAKNSSSISGNTINSFCRMKDGTLLLCTDNGLDMFDAEHAAFHLLDFASFIDTLTVSNASPVAHASITCAMESEDGLIWIGTDDGKLFSCDPLKKKTVVCNSPAGFSITRIIEGVDGKIWIGTYGDGLICYNRKSGNFSSYRSDDSSPHPIGSNFINDLFADKEGTLWITTRSGGLNMLSKNATDFVCISVQDGLPGNSINAIMQDDSSNFWIGTDQGICRLTIRDGKLFQCRVFDLIDGLPTTEFYESSSFRNENGKMFFSSGKGLISFHPDSLLNNKYKPPVVITDFQLFNRSVLPGDSTGILKTSISVTTEVLLRYDQNSFSFAFTAISFINADKNKYAYMLEGFDKDWNYCNAQSRIASYTNIPPGIYTFRVKASNNDGIWNEKGTSLQVIISGPFYKSWWFISLSIGAGIFFFYLIYYFRMKQLVQLHEIRNKISKDLHDEIGSTLSSISVYSEVAKKMTKNETPEAESVLNNIGDSARSSIDSMSDIVWAVDPKNDRFRNVIERINVFALPLMSAKNISFQIRFPESLGELKLPTQHRKNLYLILKETINNTSKYAEATVCTISVEKKNKLFIVTITDNGKGFDTTSVSPNLGGNGLINMKSRMNELGGTFEIKSAGDSGTTTTLQFNL